MEPPFDDWFSKWVVRGYHAYETSALLFLVAGTLLLWGLVR